MSSRPEDVQSDSYDGVGDGSGYIVNDSDLEFLGICGADLDAMVARSRPLGMTQDAYDEIVRQLHHALEREGVVDADVRIQGSSAHFFSGWHKSLPSCSEDVFQALTDLREKVPNPLVTERIWRTLVAQWPEAGIRPRRHPFDSMHRLGVDPNPSDYDIQICSDSMISRVHDELRFSKVDPVRIRVKNSNYAFVEKHLAEEFFLYVSAWALRASELARRPVTWALFPSEGPESNDIDERLSSHFKPSDWIIVQPRQPQET